MDIFKVFSNFADMHFLLSLASIVLLFSLFYTLAAKQQKKAMGKIEVSLKLQEQGNHQLGLVVNELRRANRLLSEMADLEPLEGYNDAQGFSATSSAGAKPAGGNPSQGAPASEGHKLYVGNIDYAASESELADYFSQFGHVEFVNIPVNRYTGKARGFGFVTFVAKEDAERAMALHGAEFKGRQIQVNFAKEREFA